MSSCTQSTTVEFDFSMSLRVVVCSFQSLPVLQKLIQITCALTLLGKGDPSLQEEAEMNITNITISPVFFQIIKMSSFAPKGANNWLNIKYYTKLHRLF